jgi:type I restriction enzyme S subunit
VQIEDVAQIVPGGRLKLTKKDYRPNGTPAFSAAGQDGFVDRAEFDQPGVVLSSIGARCGKCFFATPPWTTLANTQAILPATELCDPRFLFQYVNDEGYWHRSGSAQPFIAPSTVKKAWVALPPLAEQRKIAAILSSVDETIEKTEAVIAQLDGVKKAMLEELLTRGIPGRHSRFKQTEIGEVPEHWVIQPLGELVDFINGRAFSERDWKKTGVPIIRIQNLNGGTEFNYFQGEVEDRFAVTPNDLLFSWSGTRGTSFGPHVWRGPAGVLNQHIFNVKKLRGVTQGYLLWALRFITSRIEKAAHGGSGIVHITKGALEQFRVPVPDAAEQVAIADRLQAINEAKRVTLEELTARRSLKTSLAEALLSGTVRTKGESAA